MAGIESDKRRRLVKAAADLSHKYGLGKIALADIASSAEVPLGNIYYYFKTKQAIGEAVITQRRNEFRQLRERWEKSPSPKARLKAFIQMTVDNRKTLARSGCPVGSLCAELAKEQGATADAAALPLRELLTWAEAQFAALGRENDKETLALHLLSALQGVSLLANCYRDPGLVLREAKQLNAWIDGL
jgi:TetR/AcrR family transcriptional regulator, transcriptional repressor for nem operon